MCLILGPSLKAVNTAGTVKSATWTKNLEMLWKLARLAGDTAAVPKFPNKSIFDGLEKTRKTEATLQWIEASPR